jgi:hypothetical protein
MEMRLVVDPATLRPYVRDTRYHTHLSQASAADHAVIEAEKIVYSYSDARPKP